MLISFKVKNFLSFDSEADFSLVAGKGRSFNERVYKNGNSKILKFSALFGANGSGKSNFVKAILFSKNYIVRGNDRATIRKYNKINPADKETNSIFEYKFSIGSQKYIYGFEILLAKNEIISEWLYLSNSKSDKLVYKYERKEDEFIFGEYFKNKDLVNRLSIIADSISSNTCILFLKAVSTYNNLFSEYNEAEILKSVFGWFENNLKIKSPDSIISDYAYFMSQEKIGSILKFFNDFDLSISRYDFFECPKEQIALKLPKEIFDDLISRIEKNLMEDDENDCVMFGLSDDFYVARLIDGRIHFETIRFYHEGTEEPFYMYEESDGTKKIFKLLEILFQEDDDIIYVVDEIDRCLHPLLTYNFINAFLEKALTTNCQLIVTTHESLLLDFRLLRKDEIWFVEKENGCSVLKSIGTSNIRADKNVMRFHLLGELGAPNINKNAYKE